jgi:outer membrane protein OmpA-like peptidoglycan-associated protein
MEVSYRYLGDEQMDGKILAKLAIDYHVMYFPRVDADLRSYTGFVHNTLYWDAAAKAPYYYFDDFSFMYMMRSGESYFLRGSSESKVEFVSDLTNTARDALAQELSNHLPANKGVTVQSLDDGVLVNLGNILFDVNRASVKQDFEPQLDKLAEILRKYPRIDIAVSGHTDNTGTDHYNRQLSELRAKAISDALIRRGIDPTRISYSGYGSDKPMADNATEAGRTLNRRVEIKLITRE